MYLIACICFCMYKIQWHRVYEYKWVSLLNHPVARHHAVHYTVKKGERFSRRYPGFHLTLPGQELFNYSRPGRVLSVHPGWGRENHLPFLQCIYYSQAMVSLQLCETMASHADRFFLLVSSKLSSRLFICTVFFRAKENILPTEDNPKIYMRSLFFRGCCLRVATFVEFWSIKAYL